jgi:hypothetical protein
VSQGSSNPALIPTDNIVFGGSGANRTVTVTPAANQNGSATITVGVSDGEYVVNTNWVVTVNAVNDPPTLTGLADQTIGVNGTTGPLNFTIGDVDTAVGSLTVSPDSSNLSLVPLGNIVLGGSGANRTVTVTPAAGQSGTATITVTVSDGTNNASDPFVLTVNAAAPVAAVRVNAGGGTLTDSAGNLWSADTGFNTGNTYSTASAINNTVNDALYQTERWDPSTSPELTYAFNLPNGDYLVNLHFAEIYSGAFGAGRRVFDLLLEGQLRIDNLDIYSRVGANTALIIGLPVTLNDGQLNLQLVHGLDNPKLSAIEVLATSGPPTISDLPNQSTTVNTATAAIPLTISDPDTPVNNLTLSATSSNPVLVPTNNIVFEGSGSSRTVTVTPATGQTGTSTITVTVSDGTNNASDPFVLTVNTVNTPPTLTGVVNQSINEDTSTAALNFTVGDAETSPGSLTVSKGSSNPVLVPTNNIVLGGSGATRTVTVTPAANQNGSATITISVSDGQYVVSTNWVVTVSAVNDPPTLTGMADQTISVNGTTGPLNFTIGDVDTAVGSLTVSTNSSNPSLVPLGNIVLGGSGANRTVTVTPAADQTGVATITVSVSDGEFTVSTNFVLTVSSLLTGTRAFTNAAPTTIPDQGAGTPYPSVINVSGMGGTITNVTVTLRNLSQTWASDLDVLLVGPTGQKVVLMSDAGRGNANNVTLTLSDAAAAALPAAGLVSGTFRPTNLGDASDGGDNFPAPAPAGPYAAVLSAFNGTGANGAWSLYVFDDGAGDLGSFAGGWNLTITTSGTSQTRIASVQQPLRITAVTFDKRGAVLVTISGEVGLSYTLEASSDLGIWTKVDVQENVSGSIIFKEQPTNSIRFYRAVSRP